jgi:hypothetical protein
MQVADKAPFVAAVDNVKAAVLLRCVREGKSDRDDRRRVEIADVRVVLMQSNGPLF